MMLWWQLKFQDRHTLAKTLGLSHSVKTTSNISCSCLPVFIIIKQKIQLRLTVIRHFHDDIWKDGWWMLTVFLVRRLITCSALYSRFHISNYHSQQCVGVVRNYRSSPNLNWGGEFSRLNYMSEHAKAASGHKPGMSGGGPYSRRCKS